jgi:hypothetical protein
MLHLRIVHCLLESKPPEVLSAVWHSPFPGADISTGEVAVEKPPPLHFSDEFLRQRYAGSALTKVAGRPLQHLNVDIMLQQGRCGDTASD